MKNISIIKYIFKLHKRVFTCLPLTLQWCCTLPGSPDCGSDSQVHRWSARHGGLPHSPHCSRWLSPTQPGLCYDNVSRGTRRVVKNENEDTHNGTAGAGTGAGANAQRGGREGRQGWGTTAAFPR